MEFYRFYTQKLTKDEYIHECHALKGCLIEKTTLLEFQLSYIIAYISGKYEAEKIPLDFLYKIHKKRQLWEKIQIAEPLIKKYHLDFINANPELFGLLDKIRKFRNDITHSLLDISTEKFVYSENISDIRFYTIESSPTNNVPNCPVKNAKFESLTSDLTVIIRTTEILREFLKTEYLVDCL